MSTELTSILTALKTFTAEKLLSALVLLAICLGILVVITAGYYVLTDQILKRKLNLE